MSQNTAIQWADSTINPVMGCDGCELWPTIGSLRATARAFMRDRLRITSSNEIDHVVGDHDDWRDATSIYQNCHAVAERSIAKTTSIPPSPPLVEEFARALTQPYKCYAGILHLRHGSNTSKPEKYVNPGYAHTFGEPKSGDIESISAPAGTPFCRCCEPA